MSTRGGMGRVAGAAGMGVVTGVVVAGGGAGCVATTPALMKRAGSALAPPAVIRGGRVNQDPTTPVRMAAVVRDAAALALLGPVVGVRLLCATSGSVSLGGD